MENMIIWMGIVFCLTQSAMFSGLNLAFFSLTRLRLEIESEHANSFGARTVLSMRKDSNFLLTTILWGNVGINVLLTLLSDSVMTGILSFTFSTVFITLFGEILPQAYFSRNALKMASILAPVLRIYQFMLFPVAKPCALLLDFWLGKDAVQFFSEQNIKMFIKKHIEGEGNEIGRIEGTGAINFFSLDDQKITEEGELIHPESIINLKTQQEGILFPHYSKTLTDPFIQQINKSGEKWIIFTDEHEKPTLVLDADGFMRSEVFSNKSEGIEKYCHAPIVVKDQDTKIGLIIKNMRGKLATHSDVPIDKDVVLYWPNENKRIITGADIFGRLLKGI